MIRLARADKPDAFAVSLWMDQLSFAEVHVALAASTDGWLASTLGRAGAKVGFAGRFRVPLPRDDGHLVDWPFLMGTVTRGAQVRGWALSKTPEGAVVATSSPTARMPWRLFTGTKGGAPSPVNGDESGRQDEPGPPR